MLTLLALALVLLLYFSILAGSFTKLWGIDNRLELTNYVVAFTRGLNPLLSTTFLSAVATPLAGLIGMVIAYLVVRRAFVGKQTLDFVSNLGGAVPGTILGIGYILAFIGAPWYAVVLIFVLLAGYLASRATSNWVLQLVIVVGGAFAGYYFNWLPYLLNINEDGWRYLLAAGYTLLAVIGAVGARPGRRRLVALIFLGMALYLVIYNLSPALTVPLGRWGRTLPGVEWPKVVARLVSFIEFFTQPNLAIMGFTFLALSIFAVMNLRSRWRAIVAFIAIMLAGALVFFGQSLTLVGTPYIIVFAFAVRSLPASVRAGVASLQQVDPSIEEASNILGGDAQYTFRHVTLPLILPAFFAGLVFAFARHMTSLSAVIFLTTAQWPILTVWILSEVEQGGMSVAAAYSIILIAIVLAAIGLMSLWLKRAYGGRQDVDLSVGG